MCKQIIIFLFVSAVFVTGCSPVPLPTRTAKIELEAKNIEQTPRDVTQDTQASNGSDNNTNKAVSTASAKPIEKDLSATEHVQQGIRFLKLGTVDHAKSEFEAALKKQADNATAQKLLRQIELMPNEYFKDKPVIKAITAQPGDTFSTLAAKYLDDPLEFHILARFNDLESSKELTVGKIIKIPSIVPVKKPEIIPSKPAKVVNVEYNLAKKYYDQGRYQSAIAVLEPRVQAQKDDMQSRDLLVLTYTKYAFNLVDKANLLEAQTVLEKAVVIQPENRQLKSQLDIIEKQRNADRHYSKGLESLKVGNKEQALDSFNQAIKLQPGHELAQKQVENLQANVIDNLHKKAMVLYSNQELDEAIMNWDKVLKLNPEHELAKLYRQRAVELKERLDKF